MPDRWSIIAHGGARAIPVADWRVNRDGCRSATAIGASILRGGGSALDAVEQTVRALEDDPLFNAGTGAVPNAEGVLELDAAIMDGTTLEIGAVAALRGIANPIRVARRLLKADPVLLVGDGARAYAVAHGFGLDVARESASREGLESLHDTVGCVASDTHGRIAVATSTGGLTGQMTGRVGDAPLAGCGFYADDAAGGVAISGDGEQITRVVLASRVMGELIDQAAAVAVCSALRALERVGGEAGIIALDREGRFGIAHNSEQFAVALAANWLPGPRAGVCLQDFKEIVHG